MLSKSLIHLSSKVSYGLPAALHLARHLFFPTMRFPHLLQHWEQGILHLGEAHIPQPGCGAGGAERWPASHANPMNEMPAMSVKNLTAFFIVILYLLNSSKIMIFFSLNQDV